MGEKKPLAQIPQNKLNRLAACARAMEELIAGEIEDLATGQHDVPAGQVNVHAAHLVLAQQVMAYLQMKLTGEYQSRRAVVEVPKPTIILPA